MDGVGGTLRVERDDAGGRLVLALPIAATAPAEASRSDAAPPAQRAATAATVLVCDDEDVDPRAARPDPRARRDARRSTRRDGPAALAIIEATPVDVVLTDQHMAGMSGHRAVRGGDGARSPRSPTGSS